MNYLVKFNGYLNRVLLFFSGVAVLALTGIAAANMFLRIVYSPIPGSYELVGFFGATATGFALGYTQIRKDHIIVTMFTDRFPKKIGRLLDGLNYSVNTVFFTIIGWETLKWGMKIARTGELSETLKIVYHPFVYCLAIGFAALAFSLFVDLIRLFTREVSA
ncbi:MAG: Tripartite ATP-independent periplasmic transporter [Syntrophorhabdus sp. PtaB.Bin184]|jgi:TRAP-type C4-dicarboxylate transport system permease small subunit|nr:MAG: Tripartite ATP-independent periplasmic transporter [Syntrophorhabdus sp. PtaB.Bin184]